MPDRHPIVVPTPMKRMVFGLLDYISLLGLLTILIATVVAIGQEVLVILRQGEIKLTDLLLLFIYMEVIAMVGIYFRSQRLPVRFPVLIAMIALSRHIILEASHMDEWELLAMSASVFILGLTAVMLKYGNKFDSYERPLLSNNDSGTAQ